MSASPLTLQEGGARLSVRVTPRGGRDALRDHGIGGEGRAALAIDVSAAPDKGAANKTVTKLIAGAFGLPKTSVEITTGATSRSKVLTLSGDPSDLARQWNGLEIGSR